MRMFIHIASLSFLICISNVQLSFSCKEALCAAVVSKCLLIDACKCDFRATDDIKNCTCCKACFQCLDTLFADCCDCLDMCPRAVTTPSNLSSTSHVEDLPEPLVELFNALTEEHDATGRWTTYTYPVQRDLSPYLLAQTVEMGAVSKDSKSAWPAVNCTVAFMAQCMPWTKCKNSCRSMGASSYRWFHDGCCQCVGSYCLNYGMNETRCLNCPRISTTGIVDDEYEGPESDEERPRKHMDASNTNEDLSSQEITGDRSYVPPAPYGAPTTAKPKAAKAPSHVKNSAKSPAPARPAPGSSPVRSSG